MTGLDQPMRGLLVVSFAEQLPGPIATRLMVELGAEVIQVERPGQGDPQRGANPWLFRSAALGKKSIALDLKRPQALAAVKRLASRADVLVEGYRPGVMRRLGLGYDDVKALNPRIVYCSISGYGQEGPAREVVGHNINYEAMTGLMDPYVPADSGYAYFPSGPPLGDLIAGSLALSGIFAGLRQAERDGVGAYLDIAIADALVFGIGHVLTAKMNGAGGWPAREAGYGLFRTSDGAIALGIAHEDNFWGSLCGALDLDALRGVKHAERVTRATELRAVLAERFAKGRTQDWIALLAPRDVPCSAANRLEDVGREPQMLHRGLFQQALTETGALFTTTSSPLLRGTVGAAPPQVPELGAHTEEVLLGLGYTGSELDDILGPTATGPSGAR